MYRDMPTTTSFTSPAYVCYCASDEQNAHADAQRTRSKVIEKFGAKSVVVGTDFLFCQEAVLVCECCQMVAVGLK